MRGTRVLVSEQGIRPWTGIVGSRKVSPLTGWWLEVRRDDDGMTYVVSGSIVQVTR